MAETATDLADRIFPPLPIGQKMVAKPTRLRGLLQCEPGTFDAVQLRLLRIAKSVPRAHFASWTDGRSGVSR